MFSFVFLGGAISPAILGSAMNKTYAKTLQNLLPTEMSLITDKATLASLADPRVLLSAEAMEALEKAINTAEDSRPDFFGKTVRAIRGSLEASLKMVLLIGALIMLVSLFLIVTIPEVSVDVEVPDKKLGEGHRR